MKLVQRMSQRVVMTPLLQQAIQLLQLSTLELEQVVRKELEENPLLEEIPVENAETAEAPAATAGTADAPAPAEAPPAPEAAEQPSKETSSLLSAVAPRFKAANTSVPATAKLKFPGQTAQWLTTVPSWVR